MSKMSGDDVMKVLRSAERLWPDCGTTASDVAQRKDCVEEQGLDRTRDDSSASLRLSSATTTASCGRSGLLSIFLSARYFAQHTQLYTTKHCKYFTVNYKVNSPV